MEESKEGWKNSILGKIPSSWKVENLEDNLESLIDYRGKTPEKSDKGIVVLSAKSVKMNYIDYSNAYFISKETYKKFMVRGFPKKGDILMTTEAPLGCITELDRDNISVAQRLLTLRGRKEILNNKYLKYYLQSEIGQHELLSRATGTTVQGIKRSEFSKVNIVLPPLETQQKIASILSSLDDKIELNNEMNKTLEEMAQTLFKRWFIDFEFPN
ncbi:MAG: restriction endonuclease subunit S, partial [Fusobacteriaceae bacterium]